MTRTFVIADIHGCSRTFRRLLFDVIRLERVDTLYLLGDYIDRGPDSKGVIDIIMGLQADGYGVLPIRGNHEQMLLKVIAMPSHENLKEWLDYGGYATLNSYGVDSPDEISLEHTGFILSMPLYRTIETHIFVHAGINCHLENPFASAGEEAMLWSRSKVTDMSKCGGKVLVSGHTALPLTEIEKSIVSPHIRLDNGCVYGEALSGVGNLVALELNTGELFVQEKIDV